MPTQGYSIFRYNVLDTLSGGHALGEIEYFGVPFTVIPEPTTVAVWSLLGLCWAGLATRRRRGR